MYESLRELFKKQYGVEATQVVALKAHASERRIVRITGSDTHGKQLSVIGVENRHTGENEAFVGFARSLRAVGVSVPEVYAYNPAAGVYLQEDLGDVTLHSFVEHLPGGGVTEKTFAWYQKAVELLIDFNLHGAGAVDYNLCFASAEYDEKGMLWDLHYFRDSFLKRSVVPYDEKALEQDCMVLVAELSSAPRNVLLHRDFQARNLMVHNEKLYCIDFDRSRRGPLFYDLAKLLFQSTLQLSETQCAALEQHYLARLLAQGRDERASYERYYYTFTLLQFLHRLGAFGRFGLGAGQRYFLECIPAAIKKIAALKDRFAILTKLPELSRILSELAQKDFGSEAAEIEQKASSPQILQVKVGSFAYKGGIPSADQVGGGATSGGGFVFDCRLVRNPGREPEYKPLTGRDLPVSDFLDRLDEAQRFKGHVFSIVHSAVERYLQRGFSELVVLFGCTGGQHRSVYFAEELRRDLLEKYPVRITLQHRELERMAAEQKQ